MEIFNTLESIGLTTRILQIAVISAIVVVLLGLYWRYIAIGAGILFTIFVFAVPSANSSNTTNTPQRKIEDARKKDFMGDCQHYGDSKETCEEIWTERLSEESKL
jgi:hypothetical protein